MSKGTSQSVGAALGSTTLAAQPIGTAVRIAVIPSGPIRCWWRPGARRVSLAPAPGRHLPTRQQPGIAPQRNPDQATPARLPRGRHRLPRETVEQSQRQRLLAAVAVAVAEHGYVNLTIKHLTLGAGISRRTFYERFDDKEQVLLAAYDEIFARLLTAIGRACANQPDQAAKLRAAIAVSLGFAVREPESTRLLCADTFTSCAAGTKRVLASTDRLAALLSAGGQAGADPPPALSARTLVIALWSALGAELVRPGPERWAELAPELYELAALPCRPFPESGAAPAGSAD
jgi:AcrR family transcriptional regulator